MNIPVPTKRADAATTGRTGNTRSKSIKLPRSERLHDDIVQKEDGLITGIPKREAPESALGGHGRDHVSFVNSVNHFFGEKDKPSFSSGKKTILLHACERYLEYNGRIIAPEKD